MTLGTDLKVYNRYAYSALTEVLRQEADLFNTASRGVITMRTAPIVGDFDTTANYALTTPLIIERDAYSTATDAIAEVSLTQDETSAVKVARGSKVEVVTPSQYDWILRSEAEAGAAFGQMMAKEMMLDFLNTGVGAALAAMLTQASDIMYDATGNTVDTLSIANMISARYKFGDANSQIAAWVAHSLSIAQYEQNNAASTAPLFNFGNVAVQSDTHGVPFVMSDIASLFTAGSPDVAYVMGLVPGAIEVTLNNDLRTMMVETIGIANPVIKKQSTWSFNLKLKGFTWDRSNGGKSPNNAALMTGSNWDRIPTSHKDLCGVLLKTN
jgi:hypothetical protein